MLFIALDCNIFSCRKTENPANEAMELAAQTATDPAVLSAIMQTDSYQQLLQIFVGSEGRGTAALPEVQAVTSAHLHRMCSACGREMDHSHRSSANVGHPGEVKGAINPEIIGTAAVVLAVCSALFTMGKTRFAVMLFDSFWMLFKKFLGVPSVAH